MITPPAELELIYKLWGFGTVLLPVHPGTKKCFRDNWQRTDWQATQDSNYQDELKQSSIAVLFGPTNLGGLDCDQDEVMERFLELNPWASDTTRTRGARGATLYFRIRGDYPRSIHQYKVNGQKGGEWRGAGYTVVSGIHPTTGKPYQILVEKPPLSIEWSQIKWPPEWELPWNRRNNPDDRFIPSTAWQVKPDWALPSPSSEKYGEMHDRWKDGKYQVYWDKPVPGPETVMDMRTGEYQKPDPALQLPSPQPPPPHPPKAAAHQEVRGGRSDTDLEARIRAYIDTVDPAISGEGGSTPTYRLACALINGWALERSDAIRWMTYYSQRRCKPPWNQKEIAHKVDDALKAAHIKPRGHLRDEPPPRKKSAHAEERGNVQAKRAKRAPRQKSAPDAESDADENKALLMEQRAREVAAGIDAYYDQLCKEYPFRSANHSYQSLSEGQFKRELRIHHGLGADCIPLRHYSQLDLVLSQLQKTRAVDYAGPLAGRDCGYYYENGVPFLVTKSPLVIEPKPGEWPILSELLSNLLWWPDETWGDDQYNVFCGWLKVSYKAFRARKQREGQALALAGPTDAGKRCSYAPMPWPVGTAEEKEVFWQKLMSELPAFLHWLVTEFELPTEWKEDRFGVKAWQHPMLLRQVDELSPAHTLLELIDQFKPWIQLVGQKRIVAAHWEGSALELRSLLLSDERTKRDAQELLGWRNACGTYLHQLCKKHPDRVHLDRTESRDIYTVFAPIP